MIVRVTALLAAIVSAALVLVARMTVHPQGPAAAHASLPPPVIRALPASVAGIVTDNLTRFDLSCSCRPPVAVVYVRWRTLPDVAKLEGMLRDGAVPLVELNPYGTTLGEVAGGQSDAYIATFARALARLRSLVLVSFAPEANNDSYQWGYLHDTPAAYVAAWRHVVTVVRAAGAANARWTWIVNAAGKGTGPLPPLWPGGGYVSYAGIDGYATHRSTTFKDLFGPTIAQVRDLTSAPVLISETAADPQAGQARWIAQLIAGVRAYRLTGFLWFDINQLNGKDPQAPKGNRHDWSLTGSALAAYKGGLADHEGHARSASYCTEPRRTGTEAGRKAPAPSPGQRLGAAGAPAGTGLVRLGSRLASAARR
jgi:hypothetical protein